MQDTVRSIHDFNEGRDPRRLAIKYEKMAASAFSFFRGACHRFYETLPVEGVLKDAPAAWICGDLHFENFGSFKGDNRLVYFDLNDFDEACLAPVTWDLVRFQASLLLGASYLKLERARALTLAKAWLAQYARTLATGKPLWIERATARGEVNELLEALRGRKQHDLLDDRAPRAKGRRRIRVGGKKTKDVDALPLERARGPVVAAFKRAGSTHGIAKELRVLDVADRVAGTGSLGLERVIVLVLGEGGKNKNWLLDAKCPPASATARWSPSTQPRWSSEAERVVTLQKRLQAISPARLGPIAIGGRAFVLRELMPSEDRLELTTTNDRGLEEALEDLANVVAWAHLRGAARQGSATVDELIDFARRPRWQAEVTRRASEAARVTEADHRAFVAAQGPGSPAR
jgi:uncharacterized protein (DUF2252 family)